jgi:hypothetical protein
VGLVERLVRGASRAVGDRRYPQISVRSVMRISQRQE